LISESSMNPSHEKETKATKPKFETHILYIYIYMISLSVCIGVPKVISVEQVLSIHIFGYPNQ
jgi:hypothetical protein